MEFIESYYLTVVLVHWSRELKCFSRRTSHGSFAFSATWSSWDADSGRNFIWKCSCYKFPHTLFSLLIVTIPVASVSLNFSLVAYILTSCTTIFLPTPTLFKKRTYIPSLTLLTIAPNTSTDPSTYNNLISTSTRKVSCDNFINSYGLRLY